MKYVNFPHLRKYCKSKHNIAGGWNKIRLGSLHEYRSAEDEQIRDEDEGKYGIVLKFDSERLVPSEFIDIFLHAKVNVNLNGNRARFGNEGITTKGMEVHGEVADAWVFCMSELWEEIPNKTSDQYDSSWEFPLLNAEKFSLIIRGLLEKQIKPHELISCLGEENLPAPSFKWKILHNFGPVRYGERIIKVDDSTELNFDFAWKIYTAMYFQKPKKFSGEKEYRFTYTPNIWIDNPPEKKEKFIDVSEAIDDLKKLGLTL